MDAKQFDLFERTIQYAVDETRKGKSQSRFNMDKWMKFKYGTDRSAVKLEMIHVSSWHRDMYAINQAPSCSTAACLAGTAVMLNGSDRFLLTDPSATGADYVLTEGGEIENIADRAEDLFGFGEGDVSIFYMVDEPIGKIVDRARDIATKHGYELNII